VAEAAVHQLVMNVLFIGLKERPSPDGAPTDRQQGVHDRQPQGDAGDQDGDGRRSLLVGLHGGRRQDEPQEHAAGVAHEDRRRVEVVEQEPDDRASQGRREQHHQGMGALERDQEGRDHRDQRDTSGQAVEAIDEVHGVDDADDPEEGERQIGPAEVDRLAEGVGQHVEPEPQREQQPGHGELHRELLPGVGPPQIVVEAEQRDDDSAGKQTDHVRALGHEHAAHAAVKQQEPDHRRVKCDHDGDAAQARDRVAVNLAGRPGVIERAEMVGEPPDEGSQEGPAQHGDDEGDGGGSHAPGRVRTQFPIASTSIRVLR
jgi:hypothetical protein